MKKGGPNHLHMRRLYFYAMLDLMTVDGVVTVVELRQTLLTAKAQACGGELVAHSKRFLDGVDWARVKDVPAFKVAASEYLGREPLPSCLPEVPPGDGLP